MERLKTGFVLGYHGASQATAERLVARKPFRKSESDFDWLGPGIYFWESNPRRAISFAHEKRKRECATWEPSVVGAVIDLGACLDVTSEANVDQIRSAFASLAHVYQIGGIALPTNSGGPDRLLRRLDCAVIEHLHKIRRDMGAPPVDTVRGIFTEGTALYPGAGFHEKTHIQICVCNLDQIKGVFHAVPSV